VLVDRPETARPLVDIGADLAATRPGSELVLAHLVCVRGGGRLELGTGIGGELLQMTTIMSQLHALAERAALRGAQAVVFSRFSDDVAGELPAYVAAAEPDTVVLDQGGPGDEALAVIRADAETRLVISRVPEPEHPSAVAVYAGHSADAAAALDVAAQIAAARALDLVLTGGEGRRARSAAADLARQGISASTGAAPDGSLLVAGEDGASAVRAEVHLSVRAGSREDIGEHTGIATPASVLEPGRQQ
jgi:hypothetical protein